MLKIILSSHDFRYLLSHLLMFLGSLCGVQYGPRSDCSQLLLIYCLMYFPLCVGVLRLSLLSYALLLDLQSSWKKRKLVALLLLSYRCTCIVTINVRLLFLTAPWIGLQYVIVIFPDQTHLLFRSVCFHDKI